MISVGLFWELLAFLGWLVKTTLIMEDQTFRNKKINNSNSGSKNSSATSELTALFYV